MGPKETRQTPSAFFRLTNVTNFEKWEFPFTRLVGSPEIGLNPPEIKKRGGWRTLGFEKGDSPSGIMKTCGKKNDVRLPFLDPQLEFHLFFL